VTTGGYGSGAEPNSGRVTDEDYRDRTGRHGHDGDIRDASVGQLLSDVSRDFSTLMRQEVELAKAELKAEASKAARGAGMLGGAGFAGYMVVLFLSFALWWALENVMDAGLAALIVAAVWIVIGAVLYVVGRAQLRKVNPKPERTVETVREVPPALKPNS
jgi:hypothetical protein